MTFPYWLAVHVEGVDVDGDDHFTVLADGIEVTGAIAVKSSTLLGEITVRSNGRCQEIAPSEET